MKVIDLQTQLNNFEKVQSSLIEKLGDEEADKVTKEAVYFFSIGSNDYMGGYLGNPKTRQRYNPEQYIGMVIGNLTEAIQVKSPHMYIRGCRLHRLTTCLCLTWMSFYQVLYHKGGRKFGFLSLSPLGCLPALRALNPKANEGGCFEEASALALAHNNALSSVLRSLEYMLKGFKYCNSNFYDWLQDRINNPTKYGMCIICICICNIQTYIKL